MKSKKLFPNPLLKYIWLATAALGCHSSEPEGRPPIFLSARANPNGFLVNCTAEASARCSR